MRLLIYSASILFVLAAGLPSVYSEDETQAATNSSESAPQAEAAQESETSGTAPSQAQEEGGFTPYASGDQSVMAGSKGLEERVSLDLRNIEVSEALRFLAMKSGINLAVSKNVSGRLLLLLNNVPIKDILDIILLTNTLAYDKQGEIYNIMTEQEYKERYGRKFSDLRRVKIFQLKYAVPDRVFSALEALKSEIGRILVDQESGMVLVMDSEENLNRMQQAIDALEQQRTMRVFSLQYAKAADIEERLKPQLDAKGAGSILADERSNQVVVQTFPERMNMVADLIKSLDQKTKEVLLIAKIIKVTLEDDLDAEIKWEGFFQEINLFRNDEDSTLEYVGNHIYSPLARSDRSFVDDFVSIAKTATPTAGSKNVLTENLVFGRLGDDKVEVLLNLLKTIGKTKVLSSPRITVVNNQEAKIHIGTREAYTTSTTTTAQSGNTIAESVNFIDVGIQLAVTPTINDNGYVTMKIKPEISSVTGTLVTGQNNKIPIVDTSEAETTVMVKDRTTIVIAGLRRDDYAETDKRVPLLGDIPILGRLFRSYTSDKGRTELLVILTPYITGGDAYISGEPEPPAQAMKGYRPYSNLQVAAR